MNCNSNQNLGQFPLDNSNNNHVSLDQQNYGNLCFYKQPYTSPLNANIIPQFQNSFQNQQQQISYQNQYVNQMQQMQYGYGYLFPFQNQSLANAIQIRNNALAQYQNTLQYQDIQNIQGDNGYNRGNNLFLQNNMIQTQFPMGGFVLNPQYQVSSDFHNNPDYQSVQINQIPIQDTKIALQLQSSFNSSKQNLFGNINERVPQGYRISQLSTINLEQQKNNISSSLFDSKNNGYMLKKTNIIQQQVKEEEVDTISQDKQKLSELNETQINIDMDQINCNKGKDYIAPPLQILKELNNQQQFDPKEISDDSSTVQTVPQMGIQKTRNMKDFQEIKTPEKLQRKYSEKEIIEKNIPKNYCTAFVNYLENFDQQIIDKLLKENSLTQKNFKNYYKKLRHSPNIKTLLTCLGEGLASHQTTKSQSLNKIIRILILKFLREETAPYFFGNNRLKFKPRIRQVKRIFLLLLQNPSQYKDKKIQLNYYQDNEVFQVKN